jgi:Cu-Zn family superoxide dismutase
MNMKRWMGAFGLGGALVLASAVPAAAATRVVVSRGPLADLSPATADGTDGGAGLAVGVAGDSSTLVLLAVRGLTDSGAVHGAHVHTGPCVAGNGAIAGPHYNAGGGISDQTEVWLDFEVRSSIGIAVAKVPFAIPAGGAQSIVIHAAPTDPVTGAAGARLACLPFVL